MKRIFLVSFCGLFAACGSGSPNTPSKRKDVTPAPPPAQKNCPISQPSNAHKVTINLSKLLPAKMALKLEGDADYRLSDCASISQRGVIASWSRPSNMQLEVMVEHGSYYNNGLPEAQGLEIFDLKGCANNGAESIFKTATPLKIVWRTETPVPGCPQTRAMGAAVNATQLEE